jgi:DNA-binding MarR family transcriptional regulator
MIPPRYIVLANGTIIGPSGKTLKPTPGGTGGYLTFKARVNGKPRTHCVHVVVCEAFHGPRPSAKHQVRHLDGNHLNNEAHNLKWGTAKENGEDRVRHGDSVRGERSGTAKLTWVKVREIRSLYVSGGVSTQALADRFHITRSAVQSVVRGRSWIDPSYTPPDGKSTWRGEQSMKAKLTAQQVREIRSRYAAGGTVYRELAAEYGVEVSAISRIVRRDTWTHI